MAKKTRTELEGFFGAGSIPTAGSFADLIGSPLNQLDDGIRRESLQKALEIEAAAAGDSQQGKLVLLYESFNPTVLKWEISLKSTPNAGLSIVDTNGKGLFIEEGGNVGIGKSDPSVELDVLGSINLSGTLIIDGLDVGNTVTSQGTSLTALEGTVSSQGTSLTALEGTVSSQGTSLTALEGTVSSQGDTLADLISRVTTLESHHPPPTDTP